MKNHNCETGFTCDYGEGFNAGFAAFRDSEMMKELVEALERSDSILDCIFDWLEFVKSTDDIHGLKAWQDQCAAHMKLNDKALERYKEWIGNL